MKVEIVFDESTAMRNKMCTMNVTGIKCPADIKTLEEIMKSLPMHTPNPSHADSRAMRDEKDT